MSRLSRVALSVLIATILVVFVVPLSAQTEVITIPPGESRIIHCDTDLTVLPVNSHEIEAVCPSLPPTATSAPTSTLTSVPPTSTPTRTPLPPTNTPVLPTPTSVPPPAGGGIWISLAELAALPTSGAAWDQVNSAANGDIGTANISDQDSTHDVKTLAVALVAMRTGSAVLREKAADAIMSAIETENGGRTLALGRNLVSYVVAADIIDLKTYSPSRDATFRTWLSGVRTEVLDSRTLISTQEDRPNNWGTMAAAARIAADRYLGDTSDLANAATVFRGYLGDRSAYSGFSYGELSWQCNESAPVGINPQGCTKSGHSIDGVLPDDQRRSGSFSWPPPCGGYPHEALQGVIVAAQLLNRAGFDAWGWENGAVRRAETWLYSTSDGKTACPATGDDGAYPILVNRAYGTSFAVNVTASPGKNMGWIGWTHGD